MNVNDFASYQCAANYVTSTGPSLTVQCTNTGDFNVPNPLPACRSR